jgi:protease-4
MLQFFKYTLATFVGIILFCILALLLFVGILSNVSRKSVISIKPKTVLVLDFKGPIKERFIDNPFAKLKGGDNNDIGLNELIENIAKAKDDANISGILLDLNTVVAGAATKEEIRKALLDFKNSGKFIFAKADYYYNGNYYLASLADKIYLTPTGEMLFNGTSAQPMFYKGLLDKVGVEIQVVRHGKFKGAVEPFIKDHLSDENKLQIRKYKESVYNTWMNNVATDRKINPEDLFALAYDMKVHSPEDAKNYKLVDELAYADEVDKAIQDKLGITEKDKINYVSYSKYKNASGKKKEGDKNNKIAVIYAEGEINDGEGDEDNIGGKRYAEVISKARKDDKIKAIVLRINSPGGSALASDLIWREVKLAAEKKPVIVSMSDVAASGGYYIAAPATYIFAEPTTITGSIGVFGLFPNAQKLFNDKLGITVDTVKIGRLSDLGNFARPFTEDEKVLLQSFIERTYDNFITRVAEGRHKEKGDIDSIAQGRVWAAADALNLGLIDKIGSLEDAVKMAAEKANITSYRIA